MTQYSAPTKVPLAARLSASGFFTPVGTLAPVWQTLPSTFTQAQGTSINFASLCSDPQSFTLVFSISVNSALNVTQLAAAGITLASNGLMTIASNATPQTLNGIIVNADNQHGKNTDSAAFSIAVIATALAWTVYRNYTLVNGQLVAGTNPSILGPFASYSAAKAVTVDSASNPDIIDVLPGNYPNDAVGVDRNLKVVCRGPGGSGIGTTSTGWDVTTMATVAGFGDANMTPLSNKSVWLEGLRVYGLKLESCVGAGGPGCTAVSIQNTQNFTMNKCCVEENAAGVVSGGYCGNMTFIDCEFKDNGNSSGGSGGASTHHVYLAYGISAGVPLNPNQSGTFIGCKFWDSQDWCSYPATQEWRVGDGHFLKSDVKALTVQGCYFKTTTPGGGGSKTAKIQGDSGGLWHIDGNIIEEGLYSAYDPLNTGHGITPYASPGFAKCPTSAVTYNPTNNRIVDFAMQAQGGQIFTAPWPISEFHMRQNTVINNGRSTEKVYANSSLSGGAPSVVEVLDNVVAKNLGTADTLADLMTGSTTNTIAADSTIFVNASSENYHLNTPVAGSAANAPYEFVFPIGHKARTDSFRGAVSAPTKPLWWRNPRNRGTPLAVGEWYRFDSSTLDPTSWNAPDGQTVQANTPFPFNLNAGSPNNNSPVYNMDRDPIAIGAFQKAGTTLYGSVRDAERAIGQGGQGNFGFRQTQSWVLPHMAGHGSSNMNVTLGFMMNTDYPKYEVVNACSDYVQSVGARLTGSGGVATTLSPATYQSDGTIISGDISTGYGYYLAGVPQNNFWRYYYDGKPVMGHTGFNCVYDDRLDRMLRIGSGVAYFGTGGSNQIDSLDFPTKTWRAPNKTASALNPKLWFSDLGQSATTGTQSDDTPTAQGNAQWFLGKTIDPRTSDLYWIDSSSVWVKAPWNGTDYKSNRVRVSPNPAFQIGVTSVSEAISLSQSRNIVYYMEPLLSDANQRQKYRLQRLNIATNPPTPLSSIAVTGDLVGWLFPRVNGFYETYNGLVYEPVRDKLLYFDNGFTDLFLDAGGTTNHIYPNGTAHPTESDGSFIHIYEIDPDTGVSVLDKVAGVPISGQKPPPGNTIGGTWTQNSPQYSIELEGVVYLSGAPHSGGTNSGVWNPNGGRSIYFIRTH